MNPQLLEKGDQRIKSTGYFNSYSISKMVSTHSDMFSQLSELGIKLKINKEQLEILDPNRNLTSEILKYLKLNKSDIMMELTAMTSRDRVISFRPVEKKEYYRLSPAQTRLFLTHQFDSQSLAYNMPSVYKFKGQLDKVRLQETVTRLIRKHEALRTIFKTVDNLPVQIVSKNFDFDLEIYDDEPLVDAALTKFIRPFDLQKDVMIRLGVWNGDENYLLVDVHHIVTDAISHGLLIADFWSMYNGKEGNDHVQLSYKDFAEWHYGQVEKEAYLRKKSFWTNEFEGEIPLLDLPQDFSRPEIKSFEGHTIAERIAGKTYDDIVALRKEASVTSYMLFLSVYGILLSKLSGQEEIVIGTPSAGRNTAETHNMVGVFINMLPLKLQFSSSTSFRDLLGKVKEKVLAVLDNQDFPYEEMVDAINPPRDASRNPLFDVMFSLDVGSNDTSRSSELELTPYDNENNISKFDLSLLVDEVPEAFLMNFEYAGKLFEQERIEKYISYFHNILAMVTEDASVTIGAIDLVSKQDLEQIEGFNQTAFEFDRDQTVIDLFRANSLNNPDNVAIQDSEKSITYKEFNHRTNLLAHELIDRGIQTNDIVAVHMDRSVDFMLSVFAIMKAGAAYLPIPPSIPSKRIDYMLEDSEVTLVLTNEHELAGYQNLNINTVDHEDQEDLGDTGKLSPDNYAYVIYTSGSTGTPKGVIINQASLMNRINWMQTNYPLDNEDTVLQKTPLIFDVSVWELFWWSIAGATLSILPEGEEKDPYQLINHIAENNITTLHFVPPMMRLLLEVLDQDNLSKLQSMRRVFASGEALLSQDVNTFNRLLLKENGTQLINLYGPTEATIDVTYFECNHQEVHDTVPIGKPIHNTKIYILDGNKRQQPIGVSGELHIAGEGLSVGYINNKELTESKFYFNENLGKRLYKTGDMARWNKEGEIEFLGRSDHQVKIRGYRIELGEIENCLSALEKITGAVVIDKKQRGNVVLCAYYSGPSEMDSEELKATLSVFLPEYMIPHFFIHLDQIPLTQSGKVDRKSLPDPVLDLQTVRHPETLIEREIQEIWSDMLGIDKDVISADANFFELGGNSLIATSVLVRVQKKYRAQVLLAHFLKQPTIRQLASLVKKNQGLLSFQSICRAEKKEYYPLSAPQKRMFAVASLNAQSLAYNIPTFLKMTGQVELSEIEQVFQKIIQRHESFRTSFQLLDGVPVQRILENVNFKVDHYDCSDRDPVQLANELMQPFSLSEAPLLRVALLTKRAEESYLLIDMHHIVSDAISNKNLTNDFINLLQNRSLKPLALQYKDFVEWSSQRHQKRRLKQQEKFWIEKFQGDIPTINLPYDFEREKGTDDSGETIQMFLDKQQSNEVVQLAQANQTTTFSLILSIFSLFLSKITNQSKVVIGTMSSGRNHVDKEDIVGYFVNTLPIKISVDQNDSFNDLMRHVYGILLDASDNEDYQYEGLVEALKINKSGDRNPLFDVICVYHKDTEVEESQDDLQWEEVALDSSTSKFDLGLYIQETEDFFTLDFEYSSHLFKRETVLYLQRLFKHLIDEILSDPKIKMGDLGLLGSTDEQKLIKNFEGNKVDLSSKNIYQTFEAGLDNHYDRAAIIFNDEEFQYESIKNQIDRIQGSLISSFNLEQQDRVAVIMDRSPFLISSMFAIFKANMIIVPIDPEMPEKAVAHILNDAEVKLVITDIKHQWKYEDSWATLTEDDLQETAVIQPVDAIISDEDDLAYIIYTSGSTGNPKGVQIRHTSLANYVFWANRFYFDEDQGYNMALFSPISFDFTLTSIFSTFLRFDTLVIYDQQKQPNEVLEHMFGEGSPVRFAKLTPSHVNILSHLSIANTDMKGVILGGEAVQMHHVEQLKELSEQIKVYNEYGPTEATIGCMIKELKLSDEKITIGKPNDNTWVYIINEFNQIQPVGVAGELCISGIQLARGYSNAALTEEKFVQLDCLQGETVYKTGDVARYLSSGEIEYLGRNDDQIKVRGNRVELGQVEYHLNQMAGVNKAIAFGARDTNGNNFITAYYTAPQVIEHSAFIKILEEYLPSYMIPAYFMKIDAIPLTINGKVDRKKLPDPLKIEEEETTNAEVGNWGETEISVRKIWSDVLSLKEEKIGLSDNFYELGGQSISAISLAAKLHKSLNVALTIRQITNNPTIRQQVALIQSLSEDIFKTIKPVEKKEFYPLSPGQKRMMLLDKILANNVIYNMPGAMMIEGNLDINQLESAFSQLMWRHEMLRASFHYMDDEPIQKIHEDLTFRIQFEELQSITVNFEDLINEFITPFDLSQVPLFRVKVVKFGKDRYILVYDIHHIISDGTSSTNFVNDVIALYNGNKLNPLDIQYKDYVHWKLNKLDKNEIQKQKSFWLSEFEETPVALKLPVDMPRTGFSQNRGSEIRTTINSSITKQLKSLASDENVTMFNVLFAAYNVLLSKFCNQSDIVVGIPSEKRNHLDLDKQIGLYLNMLALRSQCDSGKSFIELLQEVKKTSTEAFDNSDYQFEELVNDLKIQRIEGRSPLFDVYFNYLNFNATISNSIEDLKFSDVNVEVQFSKYDVGFYVSDSNEKLEISCVYKNDLFKESTIEGLLAAFKQLLEGIAEDKSKAIRSYQAFERNSALAEKVEIEKQEKFEYFEKEAIDQPIHQRFETIAEKYPQRRAIAYNDRDLTYQELNVANNRLANTLLNSNLFTNDCKVSILLDDRIGMVISSLGVLKTGAVYIPLDVKQPKERLQYIIEDSQSSIVVTDKEFEGTCREIAQALGRQIDIVNIDSITDTNIENPEVNVAHDQLAYILYTSGSTGNPKGVMQTHRNVLHFCRVYTNRLQINIHDKLSFLSTFSFDAGIMDIYGALLNGATLCPYDFRNQGSIQGLKNWLANSGITIYHSIPSLFRSLYSVMHEEEILEMVRMVVLGGEATFTVDVEGFKQHFGEDCIFINGLGPTESTVTLQKFINKNTQLVGNAVTVGEPVEETAVRLINAYGEDAQVYEEGEIVYESEYLALGYFNDLEKTKASFAAIPNSPIRSYKSGDLGRRLPNNEIEYVGRKDFQTKIRGFRVELVEIEQQLLTHGIIDECVVVARETQNDKILVAFYTASGQISNSELRSFLSSRLPDYMCPNVFMQMEAIPKNNNGKVDRLVLLNKDIDLVSSSEQLDLPETDTERKIAEIWCEFLELDEVGINENFFEIGGHSLKAVQLCNEIFQVLNVDLSQQEFFSRPTVKLLSEYVEAQNWLMSKSGDNAMDKTELIIG